MSCKMTMPEYFQKFHCLGSDCHFTCCQLWNISLSKADYLKLRGLRAKNGFQDIIDAGLKRNKKDGTDAHFAELKFNEAGYCTLLNEQGLCGMQITCGFEPLPKICKTFPRDFVCFKEPKVGFASCGNGCEEVLRLLLEEKHSLRFIDAEGDNYDQWTNAPPKAADLLALCFGQIQQSLVAILQNQNYPLWGRIILLGMALKKLEASWRDEQVRGLDACLKQLELYSQGADFAAEMEAFPTNPAMILKSNYSELLRMGGSDNMYIGGLFDSVCFITPEKDIDVDRYLACKEEFWNKRTNCAQLMENVMVNYLLQLSFPGVLFTNPGEVWELYIAFCLYYSLLNFLLAGRFAPEEPLEQLIQPIVRFHRHYGNSAELGKKLAQEFRESNSDTLAHMALLLKS